MEHERVDGAGSARKLCENGRLERKCDKGTCPTADSLVERSIVLPISSCLKRRDEDDIVHPFGKVLALFLPLVTRRPDVRRSE